VNDSPTMYKLIVIISAQRHGSTTLCEKFGKHPMCVSLYEAFNPGKCNRVFFPLQNTDLESHMKEVISKYNWEQKYIVFKLFDGHETDIKTLLSMNFEISFIFLRRNLVDSYESYKKAMITQDWTTSPKKKKMNPIRTRENESEILKFNEYEKANKEYFFKVEETLISNNVSYEEIWFSDVIQETFNIEKFLY
jgi:LPS sulfotransferase NodH